MSETLENKDRKLLVVDDDEETRQLVKHLMLREGFEVITADDGVQGVELAEREDPDVIVLDLIMPKMDGLQACQKIRTFSDVYIVMLTSKDSESDKITGLSVGADDYLTKPFSAGELAARIKAMMRRPRRSTANTPTVQNFGELAIDTKAHEVSIADQTINLTRIEFDILQTLASQPRVAVSREQLLQQIWGPNWFGDEHVIDVHVSNLRQKLRRHGNRHDYITTVRGIGYRMDPEKN